MCRKSKNRCFLFRVLGRDNHLDPRLSLNRLETINVYTGMDFALGENLTTKYGYKTIHLVISDNDYDVITEVSAWK